MPSQPDATGALTFLFTDIEGSTRRWEADATSMGAALARHDALLQAEISAAGGRIFKHTGDGCLAVFTRAEQAIDAAVGIQRAFAAEPLRLRIAVHAGSVEHRDGDYFGPPLNRAARLLSAGHGGQILVSAVAASLGRGRWSPDVSLVDLGEHRLRDLSEPERIHQATAPGLQREFPELKSEQRSLGRLPVTRTSLVGRADALDELVALCAQHRLVTLSGVGGTGKTRLAIALAERVKGTLREGACFVDLAPVADPAAVTRAVAEAVGMPLVAGQDLLDDLARFLERVEAVIVLDNCEHVLEEAAELADVLLERDPDLRIIATSREALGVDGEHNWRVPSLAVELDASGSNSPAAALFLDRAEAAGAELHTGADTLATIAEIGRRLDGIPLAIELAAARAVHLTPDQILAMLDDRFTLLGGGKRRARQRQATLQAAVDWSHDLLDEREQRLLRRLAVFAGTFAADAVAAVCTDDGNESATLRAMTALVDKSLAVAVPGARTMRFRMLETIRLYAQEKLVDAGEAAAFRERHRDHYLAWSEAIAAGMPTPTMAQAVFDPEADNIRAAIDWSLDRDRPDLVVRQVVAVAWCWFQSLRADEAEAWLAATAERADPYLDDLSKVAWRVARTMSAMESQDVDALTRWLGESLALSAGDASAWGAAASWIRALVIGFASPDAVDSNLEFVDRAARHPGNAQIPWSQSMVAYTEAHVHLAGGRFADAVSTRRPAAPGADPYIELLRCGLYVVCNHLLGHHDLAVSESETLLGELPDSPGRHLDLAIPMCASVAHAGAGDPERARRLLRVQLATVQQRYAHIASACGVPIVNAGVLLALDGREEDAVRVLAGAETHAIHARIEGAYGLQRAYVARLRAALGQERFDALAADGASISISGLTAIAHTVAEE